MSNLDGALITFQQETEELLAEMELCLLALEDNPSDSESINSVFRAMHTIKGSSGLFGFDSIVAFTHEAETVLDQVRKNERQIDSKLISVLLQCKDHTAQLIEFCLSSSHDNNPHDLDPMLSAAGDHLIAQLTGKHAAANVLLTPHDRPQASAEVLHENKGSPEENWLISLKFHPTALHNGIDPLSFIRYLKTKGEVVDIITLFPELPAGNAFEPENCYLQFQIAFRGDVDKQTIESVFEFAEDDCDINIVPPNAKIDHDLQLLHDQAEEALNPDVHIPRVQKLGDMLVQIGALTPKEVEKALLKQHKLEALSAQPHAANEPPVQTPRLGEILVEDKLTPQPLIEQALKKQQQVQQKIAAEASSIRVDSNKLGH